MIIVDEFGRLLKRFSNRTYVNVSKLMCETVYLSRYSDSLRAERSEGQIPEEARFSVPVQSGPGAHPASCAMSTEFLRKSRGGRGVALTNQLI